MTSYTNIVLTDQVGCDKCVHSNLFGHKCAGLLDIFIVAYP